MTFLVILKGKWFFNGITREKQGENLLSSYHVLNSWACILSSILVSLFTFCSWETEGTVNSSPRSWVGEPDMELGSARLASAWWGLCCFDSRMLFSVKAPNSHPNLWENFPEVPWTLEWAWPFRAECSTVIFMNVVSLSLFVTFGPIMSLCSNHYSPPKEVALSKADSTNPWAHTKYLEWDWTGTSCPLSTAAASSPTRNCGRVNLNLWFCVSTYLSSFSTLLSAKLELIKYACYH